MSLADGKVSTLTSDWDNFPAWSPRGDRIAFTSVRTGDVEVYTIRPDGSGLRQLTHDLSNNGHPTWSPDGRSIFFTSSRTGWKDELLLAAQGSQSSELVIMRADGEGLRHLTDNQ
jgi:TolB protein